MERKVGEFDVRIRALTDAEIDAIRDECGRYPMWGERVNERLTAAADAYQRRAADGPAELQLSYSDAREKAWLLLLERDPEDAKAWERWVRWYLSYSEAVAKAGLQHPPYDELMEGLDTEAKAEAVAKLSAAISNLTAGDEGKEQAQPSGPTSPQSEFAESGNQAAQAAQVK